MERFINGLEARMLAHRLIYRLDYAFNEAICDTPGRVVKSIIEAGKELFGEVQDNVQQRTLSAELLKALPTRGKLTVSPQTVALSLEWEKGQRVSELLRQEEVSKALSVVADLQRKCDIDYVTRAGFRVFQFGKSQVENMVGRFASLVDASMTQKVVKAFGDITDVGICFDGKTGDGLSYHYRSGPLKAGEDKRYLEIVDASLFHEKYNVICDVDLFESNVRTKGATPEGWIRPLLKKLTQTASDLTTTLESNNA